MTFSFSNILAAASILVWASAWAATEKNAASGEMVTPPPAAHAAPAKANHLAQGSAR